MFIGLKKKNQTFIVLKTAKTRNHLKELKVVCHIYIFTIYTCLRYFAIKERKVEPELKCIILCFTCILYYLKKSPTCT